MSMVIRWLSSFIFLLAFAGAAGSTTVYKSVDRNGVVEFSDTPPSEGGSVETFRIVVPFSNAAESLQQLEAMRQTTDRMASDRQEREAQRELVRLRAAAKQAAARQKSAPREEVRYEYIYLPAPIAPPWRQGHHAPRRPYPHRPGGSEDPSRLGIIPGPNSQLMRPILSRPRN
jgi:uncharacterized iron-regulated membrane protein